MSTMKPKPKLIEIDAEVLTQILTEYRLAIESLETLHKLISRLTAAKPTRKPRS